MRMFGAPVDPAVRGEDGFFPRGAEVTRLEAFVDAAFAFAISLMVISVDEIPRDGESLLRALKSIPAFAASFLVIITFWNGHADWSRRYGLDDRTSRNLSLVLVFLVLVFVYPLRMVFSAFFAWASNGALPADLSFTRGVVDLRLMFGVFAIGFGAMGILLVLLNRHAWRRRELLALDAIETRLTRLIVWRWSLIPLFSLVSLLLVFTVPVIDGHEWLVATPGLIFFVLHVVQAAAERHQRRLTARLLVSTP